VFFLNKPIKLGVTGKRQAVINRMSIDFQKIHEK